MFSPEIFKKYGSNVSSLLLDSYESKSFRMFPDIIDSAFYSLNSSRNAIQSNLVRIKKKWLEFI